MSGEYKETNNDNCTKVRFLFMFKMLTKHPTPRLFATTTGMCGENSAWMKE